MRAGGSREKGKKNERAVASKLRETFPEIAETIRRGLQGRNGQDVCDVSGLPGFWLECKHGRQVNIRAAYQQALSDSKGRGFPVAVIRDHGSTEQHVYLSLGDFLRILRSAYGYCPPLRFGVQGELFEDVG